MKLLADMPGVRREGVTVAAGHLQDIGAISYVRDRIQILNARNWKGLRSSVIELSKTSSIGYLDKQACDSHCLQSSTSNIWSPAVFITAELSSFPSIRFFEVSTIPIASFARLKTVRLFSKNTLSHARLVVCGK